MTDQDREAVPGGFERLPEGFGFNDALQPVFRRVSGETAAFGIVVEAQHVNSMGICHGGVLMVLADMTAASGVNLARGQLVGSPTINLSIDFIAAGRVGQWIEARSEEVSVRRRFAFCSGAIYSSRGRLARFNGTFYLPDHDGMWKNGKTPASVLGEPPGG
ncbi:MAG: PaaI family thioesterase [Halioglobus sp.]|nr:PaaI family thioesterase [Halioglobus sp.]